MNSALQEKKMPRLPERKLPITVTCVLKTLADYNNPDIHAIRDHCNSINIMFESRIYNSYVHRHDRDQICRLPAFHIYTHTQYQRTFYPDTRPLDHIGEVRAEYLKRVEKTAARKKAFREMFQRFMGRLRSLLHRKTRMEMEVDANTAMNSKTTRGIHALRNGPQTIIAWD